MHLIIDFPCIGRVHSPSVIELIPIAYLTEKTGELGNMYLARLSVSCGPYKYHLNAVEFTDARDRSNSVVGKVNCGWTLEGECLSRSTRSTFTSLVILW